jgi:hypothetical protein
MKHAVLVALVVYFVGAQMLAPTLSNLCFSPYYPVRVENVY